MQQLHHSVAIICQHFEASPENLSMQVTAAVTNTTERQTRAAHLDKVQAPPRKSDFCIEPAKPILQRFTHFDVLMVQVGAGSKPAPESMEPMPPNPSCPTIAHCPQAMDFPGCSILSLHSTRGNLAAVRGKQGDEQ